MNTQTVEGKQFFNQFYKVLDHQEKYFKSVNLYKQIVQQLDLLRKRKEMKGSQYDVKLIELFKIMNSLKHQYVGFFNHNISVYDSSNFSNNSIQPYDPSNFFRYNVKPDSFTFTF